MATILSNFNFSPCLCPEIQRFARKKLRKTWGQKTISKTTTFWNTFAQELGGQVQNKCRNVSNKGGKHFSSLSEPNSCCVPGKIGEGRHGRRARPTTHVTTGAINRPGVRHLHANDGRSLGRPRAAQWKREPKEEPWSASGALQHMHTSMENTRARQGAAGISLPRWESKN